MTDDAVMTAAWMQMGRDELWRNPPLLAADCEHDLLCLLVIESRQTVICRKCGGLTRTPPAGCSPGPARLIPGEDGSVVRLLDSGLRVTYDIGGCP